MNAREFAEQFALKTFLRDWPEDFSFSEVIELIEAQDPAVKPKLGHELSYTLANQIYLMAEDLTQDLRDELEPSKREYLKRKNVQRLIGHGMSFVSPLYGAFVIAALENYANQALADDPETWPKNSFITHEHWLKIASDTLALLYDKEQDESKLTITSAK